MKVCLFGYLGRPSFLAHVAFYFFTSISAADVMSAQRGLDHYFSINSLFHHAYK
jgi:hypothetical protein